MLRTRYIECQGREYARPSLYEIQHLAHAFMSGPALARLSHDGQSSFRTTALRDAEDPSSLILVHELEFL
jgi:hypothetical protein